MYDPYQALANAIVEQAVKDYRIARHRLKHYPQSRETKQDVCELEQFFSSRWYATLTKVSGSWLLKRLQEECK